MKRWKGISMLAALVLTTLVLGGCAQPLADAPPTDTAQEDTSSPAPVQEDTTPPAPAQENTTPPAPAQENPAAGISETQAREIALNHAGLSENQVTFLKSKLEREDGRQVYDVEFHTADYQEFDYEIDAANGTILSYDYDAETSYQPGPSQSQGTISSHGMASYEAITAEEAKALALARVPGATEQDIRKFESDSDHGHLEYEGEIRYNGMEYEFEIDASTGTITKWEEESIH